MRRKGEPVASCGDRENAVLVGRLLRDHRLNRGLTVAEVAQAIRVGERHVHAVEEGRVEDLPPQPYARGLVSAYATLIGLEAEELLRVCGAALAGEGPAQTGTIFRYPLSERFVWREWTLPFALAAAVLAILVARAVLSPAPVDLPAPVIETTTVVQPVQAPALLAEVHPPPEQPAGEPVPAPGVRLILRCEGKTWAEASSDGSELRRYELGPGQNLTLTARERLSVSLGDAGVVRLRINERELGFIGFKGETKLGLSFTAGKAPPLVVPPRAGAGD
jgi:transcriptional regulator with XRE-family HTH domain